MRNCYQGFVHTTVSTAQGLAELVSKWLVDHGLDLCKIRGQGYDGPSGMSDKVKGSEFILLFIVFHKSFQATNTDISDGELQYLHDSWDNVLLSVNAMSCSWGIKPEFTDKRQRRTKKFHDELSSDSRLPDPMQAFNRGAFYKLVDVAINQLELRLEGQRQVVELFKFIFFRDYRYVEIV